MNMIEMVSQCGVHNDDDLSIDLGIQLVLLILVVIYMSLDTVIMPVVSEMAIIKNDHTSADNIDDNIKDPNDGTRSCRE